MATHETRSAMYCGEMVSRNSQPAGRPMVAISRRSPRASRSPLLIWNCNTAVNAGSCAEKRGADSSVELGVCSAKGSELKMEIG